MGILAEIQERFWLDITRRFWSKVDRKNDDECWPWIGWKNDKGYGTIQIYKKPYYAHRISYEIAFGPIENNYVVMHDCDNSSCVNPGHLKAGTQLQNMRDMIAKGRDRRPGMKNPLWGIANPAAVISAKIADQIRAGYDPKKGYRHLAKQFNISKSQAYRIVKGLAWANP